MAIVNENDENKNYFAKNMVFKVFAYVASCGVFVSNAHWQGASFFSDAQIHKELKLSIYRYVLRVFAILLSSLSWQTFYCRTKLFYEL